MDKTQAEHYLADITEAMQALWDKYGWIQGVLGGDETGMCLRGCWYRATGMMDKHGETFSVDLKLDQAFTQAVTRALENLFPGFPASSSPEFFNDARGRSEEDVRLVAKHAVLGMADLLELE